MYLDDAAARSLKGVTVLPEDVLLNITGDSILRCCMVPDAVLPARVNQHVAIIRSAGSLLPQILQKYLTLPAMKDFMLGHSAGGTRKAVTKGHIENFPIPVPPLPEQRGIAATLGALDDKIESNRRLMSLVPDVLNAEVVRAIDAVAVTTMPVAALARFVNGGAFTKGATGKGRMVIRISELNSGPGGSTVYNDLDVPDEKLSRPGDLLMAWSGSLGIYRWALDGAIVNQHIFKVIPDGFPAWLVHDRLQEAMPTFRSIAKDKATTMGHIQRGHLEATLVAVPSDEAVSELHRRCGPIWDRLLLAEREIHRLAALRDALLPELLSGRIRVPEAREVVDAAT